MVAFSTLIGLPVALALTVLLFESFTGVSVRHATELAQIAVLCLLLPVVVGVIWRERHRYS